MQEDILNKVSSGELSPQKAYETMYPEPPPSYKGLKKARFVRFRMHIPNESSTLNAFLRILFIFPIPVSLLNVGLRFMKKPSQLKEKDVDFDALKKLVKYSGGTRINILSKDANITIKID